MNYFDYDYELRQELKAKKGWRAFCEREKSIVEGVVGEETTTKDNSKNLEEVGISFIRKAASHRKIGFVADPRRVHYWTSAPPAPPTIEEMKASGEWDTLSEQNKQVFLEAKELKEKEGEKTTLLILSLRKRYEEQQKKKSREDL